VPSTALNPTRETPRREASYLDAELSGFETTRFSVEHHLTFVVMPVVSFVPRSRRRHESADQAEIERRPRSGQKIRHRDEWYSRRSTARGGARVLSR
jgi:hypothetical protein